MDKGEIINRAFGPLPSPLRSYRLISLVRRQMFDLSHNHSAQTMGRLVLSEYGTGVLGQVGSCVSEAQVQSRDVTLPPTGQAPLFVPRVQRHL